MKHQTFLLRLPSHIHKSLLAEAHEKLVSMNQLILSRIASKIGGNSGQLIMQEIANKLGALAVIQFGSFARGENTKTSDIDWLVVLPKETKITRTHYQTADEIVERRKGDGFIDKISISLSHPPEDTSNLSNFWLEVGLDGILLFYVPGYATILSNIKNQIAKGSYQRKFSGGQPYWINTLEVKNAK